jgi:hypothetical protein
MAVNGLQKHNKIPPPVPTTLVPSPLAIYLLVAFKLATASTVTDRIASAEALGM